MTFTLHVILFWLGIAQVAVMTPVRLCWLERSWRRARRKLKWHLPAPPARGTGGRWVLTQCCLAVCNIVEITNCYFIPQWLHINIGYSMLWERSLHAHCRCRQPATVLYLTDIFKCKWCAPLPPGNGLCWSNQAMHHCPVQPLRPDPRHPCRFPVEVQSAGQYTKLHS